MAVFGGYTAWRRDTAQSHLDAMREALPTLGQVPFRRALCLYRHVGLVYSFWCAESAAAWGVSVVIGGQAAQDALDSDIEWLGELVEQWHAVLEEFTAWVRRHGVKPALVFGITGRPGVAFETGYEEVPIEFESEQGRV